MKRTQEEQIRMWIRNILSEMRAREEIRQLNEDTRLLTEDEALYNTFVAPFTDVLKATALAGQDILNAVRLNIDMLFTLDPDKMDKILGEYDKRHAAIEAKWKPLMDATDAALTTGDAGLVAFVLAPQMYLGAKLGKAAYDKTGDIYQYLDEVGMTIPLMGMLPGYTPPKQTTSPAVGGSGGAEKKGLLGTAGSVLKGLADIFFIAHHAPSGPLLSEAEEEEKPEKKGSGNFEEDLAKFFEETGLDKEFEKSTDDLLESKKEHVEKVMEVAELQLEAITLLGQAADVESFKEAFKKLGEAGVDLQASGVDKVEGEVQKAAETLAGTDDFKKQVASEKPGAKKDAPPEVSDTEVLDAAMKVSFNNSKQNLQKQLVDGIDTLKKSTSEELDRNSPKKDEMAMIGKSSGGKEFVKILENAKKKVDGYTLSL
jgi:hypothetical protein